MIGAFIAKNRAENRVQLEVFKKVPKMVLFFICISYTSKGKVKPIFWRL